MDTQLLQITLIIALSAVIGLMDKVKHHWEQTWFSTVARPTWLAKYFNPHYTLHFNNKFLQFLFDYPLAGLGDFWHALKAIMLQLIFILAWVSYNESSIFVWLVICNAAYGVIFEVVFLGVFNKKTNKKIK